MPYRFIISGGGTGGHIFPAISIANALKKQLPDTEILFVGALGRMEMERVPAAGYPIKGLPVSGLTGKPVSQRQSIVESSAKFTNGSSNYTRFQTRCSDWSRRICQRSNPESSFFIGHPTLIQEQNSYAGITNKLLAKKAARICVAYEGMERFFPKEKLVLTGNPVRQELLTTREKAMSL
jgi:UDP-N-acetylglucosamine--N-acetylmuramyl-(pentapeptide) pyrophosphoryl-undecaprenol N-acetylglucosamine transferase